MLVRAILSQVEFLNGIQGVIFDCDGVLVDSRDANRMYYNKVREKLGMLSITPEEEEYVHCHSVTQSIAHIVPVEHLAEAEAARKSINYKELFEYTFLQEGLVPLLTTLRDMGYLLGVNTNRTDSMEDLLEFFELTHFFSPVITAGKVGHPKPSPEGVSMILREWELPRGAVSYIGDSILDERTARAAGVDFWAYKNPKLTARVHVNDFDILRECFVRGCKNP